MDDRKKKIAEFETVKRESLGALNSLLEEFGKKLLLRGDPPSGAEEIPESLREIAGDYRRLEKEFADSLSLIEDINIKTVRLRELEEQIRGKADTQSAVRKELSAAHGNLGKIILDDPEFAEFTAVYRLQAEQLSARIDSLGLKIAELDEKSKGNILIWIGKNARDVVLQSMLRRNRESLERVYQTAGEYITSLKDLSIREESEAGAGARQIAGLWERIADFGKEIEELRAERQRIGDSFGDDGNPVRRIHALERRVEEIKKESAGVCRSFGKAAADIAFERGGLGFLGSAGEDASQEGLERESLDKIQVLRERVKDCAREIERLEAAIEIDGKRSEILRLEKSIEGQRQKIEAAEQAVAGFEADIDAARKKIGELEQLQ